MFISLSTYVTNQFPNLFTDISYTRLQASQHFQTIL
ncbi:hypothetical protein VPAL9027_02304 [Vibrio palustris]|uniref:Uncharacterized protein n=1 Tax=Vibrio palustris TaxID=1918946 RepID=A0A1R4B5X3_9VIBR|nr:hypothetical protein VPAL9027_02304 [Vibrio palustris]